jgi:hypothetical protein
LASPKLTEEDRYLKRGAIIVKRHVVSACASDTAGLDKACPRDFECTPCRRFGGTGTFSKPLQDSRRKRPSRAGQIVGCGPPRWAVAAETLALTMGDQGDQDDTSSQESEHESSPRVG